MLHIAQLNVDLNRLESWCLRPLRKLQCLFPKQVFYVVSVVRGLQSGLVWLFSLEPHVEAQSALCLFYKQWLMSFISTDTFCMTQQRSVSQVAMREVVCAAVCPSFFCLVSSFVLKNCFVIKAFCSQPMSVFLGKCLKGDKAVKLCMCLLCSENGD